MVLPKDKGKTNREKRSWRAHNLTKESSLKEIMLGACNGNKRILVPDVLFEGAEASASHDKEIKRCIHSSAAQLLLGVSPIHLEHHANLHGPSHGHM